MKRKVLILIIFAIINILLTCFTNYFFNRTIDLNIDIFLILSLPLLLIYFICIYNVKIVYNNIIKYRYVIVIFLLIFLVIGKYHGSSITLWDNIIQPNSKVEYNKPILGIARGIRSDEWLVQTLYSLGQFSTNPKFKYFNDNFRAKDTDMFLLSFAPVKDISIISKPFNLGYILLGRDYGLSFFWYGRLIVLFLVTFELAMILSNKKSLISLMASIIIALSSVVSWWFSTPLVDILIFGQLACILLYYFFKTNKYKKVLISFGLFISIISYAMALYPAWQITFGYIFITISIYILFNQKLEKKDIFILLLIVASSILFTLRNIKMSSEIINIMRNTVYPGDRFINGGEGIERNFGYPLSLFFPYSSNIVNSNVCESSSFYSLFPIPYFLSIIILFKTKFKNKLLMLFSILSTLFISFMIIPFPYFMAKITFLYTVIPSRMTVPIGLLSIYMLILILSDDIKINLNSTWKLMISSVSSVIILYINTLSYSYGNYIMKILSAIFLAVVIFLLLNKEKMKYLYCFILLMCFTSVVGGLLVNPISKTTNVLFDKPIINKIKELKDDSKWIVFDSYFIGNYLALSGVKTINATNCYPNLELWKKIDETELYKDIYNRYAHIIVNYVEDNSNFELLSPDLIKLNINYSDLKKIDVEYIVSENKILTDKFVEIYFEDGIYIYELK